MPANPPLPDFDSDPDTALRQLWQAAPPDAAPAPSAATMRGRLQRRRHQLLRRQAGTFAVLLLAPLAIGWVGLRVAAGPLGWLGLGLAGLAVLAAAGREFYALRLLYAYPALEAPPRYVARLRRYYQWQQRYGLLFYRVYVLVLNTGLALFFVGGFAGQPAWQLGLVLGLALLTAYTLRKVARRHTRQQALTTARLLRSLVGYEAAADES